MSGNSELGVKNQMRQVERGESAEAEDEDEGGEVSLYSLLPQSPDELKSSLLFPNVSTKPSER